MLGCDIFIKDKQKFYNTFYEALFSFIILCFKIIAFKQILSEGYCMFGISASQISYFMLLVLSTTHKYSLVKCYMQCIKIL